MGPSSSRKASEDGQRGLQRGIIVVRDDRKTKPQLLAELAALGQRVAELEGELERDKPAAQNKPRAGANGGASAEAEREEAIVFLGSIVENIPDMIFVKDAEYLRFVRFNRAGEELLGYEREQLIGKCDHDFFPKEEADFFTSKDREVLANGRLVDIPAETILTAKKGTRTLHTKKIPIPGPDGAFKYLLGISEDITDRERAAEAVRETEKLRELDRLKDNFLSSVSHELRTPLVSLQGYVELLLKEDVPRDKAVQWLSVVHRSAKRLDNIINGLLDVAKLQSGAMRYELGPVDMTDLVETCVDSLEQQVARKRLTIQQVVAPDLRPAHADRSRLQSVVLNLIDNAVKFSHEGGTITLEVREWSPTHLLLSVQDGGIGIPKRYLGDVFNRFFQVQSSTTRHHGGSGIGLSLVKEIVEGHGGVAWVKSEEGKGSTFFITLPVGTGP